MRWILTLAILWFYHCAHSQVDQHGEIIIENAVRNTDNTFENESIIEDLQYLHAQPININDTLANYSPLIQYGILSPLQARQILLYIRKYGVFITKKELIAVPGISLQELEALLPYVSIQKNTEQELSTVQQIKFGRSQLLLRNQFVLEDQAGYQYTDSTESKFAGNKHHLYLKFRHRFQNKVSIGLLGDKDAGEAFFKDYNQSGFDYYSGHIKISPNSKWINQINIGDYEVKLGQGLIQWNGFSLGKGADATTVFLKGKPLREYTSSNEINFLRGLAANLQVHQKLNTTLWFSHKAVDGNQMLNDSLQTTGKITSLPLNGYHRITGEIEDKRSTNETVFGTNIEYENTWLKLGLSTLYRKLSDSLVLRGQEYQKFYPKGNTFGFLGVHYSILKSRSYLFGEAAVNKELALATIHGIQHFFQGGLKGTLVYRNYAKDYKSFYANGFSENTSINNEEGFYLGLEYSPVKHITLQTYFDWFRFPWKKFRVSKPSSGQEMFFQAAYKPSQQIELAFRSKLEQKEIDISGNALPAKILTDQKRYSNRLEFRYRPNELIYLKTRVGHSFYEAEEKENGFLVFQDVIYQFPTTDLKLYGRFASFNTDGFDSRVYAYENDLLYNFSVPAFYGKGVRWYAMASYEVIDDLKIWLKGSQTIFSNRESISSGNTEINGNTRTDVKMQLQWKF